MSSQKKFNSCLNIVGVACLKALMYIFYPLYTCRSFVRELVQTHDWQRTNQEELDPSVYDFCYQDELSKRYSMLN